MATVQFSDSRRSSSILQLAGGTRPYPTTVRSSGWSFYQGQTSLQPQKGWRSATVEDAQAKATVWLTAADPGAGHRAGDRIAVHAPWGRLSFEARSDGALVPERSNFAEPANAAQIKAVGRPEHGRQVYNLTAGSFQCTVVNDGGRLTVSEDHGPAGKSPGDWSMQSTERGDVELGVTDQVGRDVLIVDELAYQTARKIGWDIRGLLAAGDEQGALATYREARTHGNEYIEEESPQDWRNREYVLELNQEVFRAITYVDGSDAEVSVPLLQELGFTENAAKLLSQERPYRVDLFGADRVETVSNLQVLYQLRSADPVPLRSNPLLYNVRNWVNAWDEKGDLQDLVRAGQNVYEQQGGQIERYDAEGFGPMNLDGMPDTARAFNDEYR